MIPGGAHELPRDHLDRVLRVVRRGLRHALVGVAAIVICLGLAQIGLRLKPRRYLSQEVLYYEEGIQWDAASEGRESSRHVGSQLKEFLLTRTRLKQVILELGLYPRLVAAGRVNDAVEEMLVRTTFRVNDGSTFTITYVGESAADAQRATARLAELVIAEHARQRSQQVEVARRFLEEQTLRAEEQLWEKEKDLAHFLAEHPAFLQEGGARASAAQLGQPTKAPLPGPSRELLALRQEIELLRQRVTASPSPPPPPPPDPELLAAERQTRADLDAAQRNVSRLREHLTDSHPEMVAATKLARSAEEAHRQALEALRASAPARSQEPVPDYTPTPAAPPTSPEASGELPRQKPAAEGWREASQTFAERETEFARLTRATAEERDRFQRLDAKRFLVTMAARLNATGSAAQISIIDPAYLPARPLGPSARLLLVASLLASLAVGLGVALLGGLLDDRVFEAGDVEQLGLAGVLALVPRARRGRGDHRLVLELAPDSAAAAAFRLLRHRLAGRDSSTTILVTSPGRGEGRTTCALNLSLALSEKGRARVLLLEGDFRHPALGPLLGLQGATGPAGAPGPDGEAPWPLVDHLTPFLDVAVARPGSSPSVAGMRSRVEELRKEGYQWIVIDGPAVLGTADVHLLEEGLLPRILLTAWRGRTRARSIRAAIEQLGPHDELGVVLLGAC